MRRPLAICCRISALGRRSPRSIWLRYGLDTPAADASWRIEILACSRCWRMYSPMEPTFMGLTTTVNHTVLAIASGAASTTEPQVSRPAESEGERSPDLADDLAAAVDGKIGDLVQRPGFGLRHAQQAQQRHGHGRHPTGVSVLALDRPGAAIGERERLNYLRPGLHQQPGHGQHERPFRARRAGGPLGVRPDGIGDAAFC